MTQTYKQRSGYWFAAGVLAVIGLYAYVSRDFFKAGEIEITHRVAVGPPVRGPERTNQNTIVTQLVFGLNRKCKLTEIKVFPVAALKTGSQPSPVWHLVSDSNSIPVRLFAYGDHVRGLRPFVKKSRPQPLESNVTYRLILKAGREKGEHDFTVGETITPAR